jgi:hypothetical protein
MHFETAKKAKEMANRANGVSILNEWNLKQRRRQRMIFTIKILLKPLVKERRWMRGVKTGSFGASII